MKEESMKDFFKELLIFILIDIGLLMLVLLPSANGYSELASYILGGECGLLAHFIKKSINN